MGARVPTTSRLDLSWVPGGLTAAYDDHTHVFTMGDEGTTATGFENIEILLSYGENTVLAGSFEGSLVLWGNGHLVAATGTGNDQIYSTGIADDLSGGNGDDYFNLTGFSDTSTAAADTTL